jgi:hypothetical protein
MRWRAKGIITIVEVDDIGETVYIVIEIAFDEY